MTRDSVTKNRVQRRRDKGRPMSSTTDAADGRITRLAGSKRLQGAALGLAAGSLLTTGVAVASARAPAAAPPVIHGCVSKTTRVLTVPLSGSRCPRGTTALNWNTTGRRAAGFRPAAFRPASLDSSRSFAGG